MVELKVVYLPLDALSPYEKNTRKHEETDLNAIKNSIQQFQMCDPIGIWGNKNIIVEGHGRLLALKALGHTQAPCIRLDHLTDEQRRAYGIAHNKTAELSDWDFDLLEKELSELQDIDFDMQQFGFDDLQESDFESKYEPTGEGLTDKFLIPPFSILDTRQGYWQTRKRQWKEIGIESEKGRKENLTFSPNLPEYSKYGGNLKGVAPQTSIFDPVLCEVMYKWFNVESGSIYDCFAGGSVRGIIAEKLGYKYTGIDLRQEQIDANIENAKEIGVTPQWYCDDSKNADKYIDNESVDMVFSCPPYADLEVYSDDPRDISNMEYADFCEAYRQIISTACNKLKQDRFAVFVVGDIRDKKGFYRNFIDFTKKCFNDNGLLTYNELILIEQIGTAAMRVSTMFKNRKVAKTHQNILVFYKGDTKNIRAHYSTIQVDEEFLTDFIENND